MNQKKSEQGQSKTTELQPGPKQQNSQLIEIYIVRALAILGVLLVHTASVPVGDFDVHSRAFSIYNFVNTFNRFGTTTFIFLSALVLFYSYYRKPLTIKRVRSFFQRRLLYILLPYVICCTYYYVIQIYYTYGETWELFWQNASWSAFLSMVMKGEAFYHLYFIFISIQLYLFFPLMLWFLQRWPKLTKHLVWMGLAIQWVFVYGNEVHWWQVENKATLAISYTSYYFLGAFFGIYYNKIKEWLGADRAKRTGRAMLLWLPLWLLWLSSSLYHVYTFSEIRRNGYVVHPLGYELLWNIHTLTAAVVLLQAAILLSVWLRPFWLNAFIRLGVASFGIYIVHAALLFFYFRIPTSTNPLYYHLHSVGGFVAALAVSWGLVALAYKFLPYSWVIFGAQPKVSPYVERNPSRTRQRYSNRNQQQVESS
ncbi:acyltransferase [Paenibacillus senegalensis]|uniref:acyltransferase n=1 Tax=Paenibacillus senegalensis TaxID=1465766 RepID=UPI00028A20C0|nr:acyltransferase [Paenibacillus senegalensis]